MSVASSVGSNRPPLRLQPNASFLFDEVTDEEEQDRVAPHALHNKRFTRKYLKSVFPSGFGVQSVRMGEDLLKKGISALAKQQISIAPGGITSLHQRAPIQSNMISANNSFVDLSPEASLASLDGPRTLVSNSSAPIVPNLLELNNSLASHVKLAPSSSKTLLHVRGTTGTFAPLASFTDVFKGKDYLNFDRQINDSILEDDNPSAKGDKGAPDDFADVAGPYFTEVHQAPAPEATRAPASASTMRGDTGDGSDRPNTTYGLLKSVGTKVVIDTTAEKQPPPHYVPGTLEAPHGMSLSISTAGSERSPPPPNKELVTRQHYLWQKPSGIDQLREYVHRARIPDLRQSAASMQIPALLPSLPQSVRSATGTGGAQNKKELHGIPTKAPFGMFGTASRASEVVNHVGSWEMGASVASEAAARAGYGAVVDVPGVPVQMPGVTSVKPLTQDKHNASGFLLSYDEWMKGSEESSRAGTRKSTRSGVVAVTTTDTAASGLRVEVKLSRHGASDTLPDVGNDVEIGAAAYASGLGYQTFPKYIRVQMYSFQQVLRSSSVSSMKPQYEFDMNRELTLEQLCRLVLNKAAQINAHELRFDEQDVKQAVIFSYTGVGSSKQSWRPIERQLDWDSAKLSSLSFLKDPTPLHLMYSINLKEDLDEAYLYENTPTLSELRDFEKLGYPAPENSAGFGLRQTQGDGSPAASRTRASTAPSTSDGTDLRKVQTSVQERVSSASSPIVPGSKQFPSDIRALSPSGGNSVRAPRPASPTVSRSSSKAVAAVSGASGSGTAIMPRSRPPSPDMAKTKFPLTKTSLSFKRNNFSSLDGKLTSELNDLAGGLLGAPEILPPSLALFDYPPPAEKLNEGARNDDSSVASLRSVRSKHSVHRNGNTITQSATLNTVDMNLMSKYGSPPRPSFGQKKSEKSPPHGKKKSNAISPQNAQAPLMREVKSLSNLLLNSSHKNGGMLDTQSLNSEHSVMSLSQVRDEQITKTLLANMSREKQSRIATELESRLMLTKW
jgi:hypothetical protein